MSLLARKPERYDPEELEKSMLSNRQLNTSLQNHSYLNNAHKPSGFSDNPIFRYNHLYVKGFKSVTFRSETGSPHVQNKEKDFIWFVGASRFYKKFDRPMRLKRLHKELSNLHEECEEEGYELFDDVAKENTKKILDSLFHKFPECDYDIYPDCGREINVECFLSPKGRILISCDSEGGVTYFRSFNGEIDDHRYQNINSFNFNQLYEAFKSFGDLNNVPK